MRTFLAFRFKDKISEDKIRGKSYLLKNYYQNSYLNYNLEVNYTFLENSGSIIIDDKNAPVNFPNKIIEKEKEIINYFPPLEIVNHKKSNSERIAQLSNLMEDNIEKISDLSSPFLFSVLNKEKEEMIIYSDALGMNRLYILETNNGVFWSNRPSALLIFSHTKAEIDLDSWKIYAAAGWFMNNRSPFKNIRRANPGTVYKTTTKSNELYETINVNGIKTLLKKTANTTMDYQQIADEISKELKAFNNLWNVKLQVDISGGIDSRVAAASTIYSNIDKYSFRSIQDIDAEVLTAQLLLARADVKKTIKILNPLEYIKNQESLTERAMKLLFEFDGDFATVMLNSPIIENNNFNTIEKTQVFGFGGEVAKGAFYSNQRWLDKLKKLGDEAPYYRLTNHFSKVGCVHQDSLELMNNEISNVLKIAESYGVENIKALDFFHFYERFRRWTPTGDRPNFFSPFLNKSFISLGLVNHPESNMKKMVHSNLIHAMQPEWNDIPVFKATPEQSKEKDYKNLRIWQTKDKIDIENILINSDSWNDVFVEDEVVSLWNQAKKEGIPNYRETLFQRVALRSFFNTHINLINKHMEKTT